MRSHPRECLYLDQQDGRTRDAALGQIGQRRIGPAEWILRAGHLDVVLSRKRQELSQKACRRNRDGGVDFGQRHGATRKTPPGFGLFGVIRHGATRTVSE